MVDTKNWTWVLERQCPECSFVASQLDRSEIPAATRSVAEQFAEWLTSGDEVGVRPEPEVWSTLEYGCHVRDVFTVMSGRLQLMLAEDDPTFLNWDQDATSVEEQYDRQDPATVSAELLAAGFATADAFAGVKDDEWERAGLRSDGSSFTVESLGQYMVHDLVHHVWDIERLGG